MLRNRSRIDRARLARRIVIVACATALVPVFSATAAVTVSKKIEFATAEKVRAAVVDQCKIQTLIPEAIATNSNQVELVDGKGSLMLQITQVHAPGGWIFSGPKWIQVSGKLKSGGKELSFRAKRYSAFNPFAGGTCGILARISRAIGSDIAAWIESPTPDAELGDAK